VFTRDGTPVPEGSRFTITGRTGEDVRAAGELTPSTRTEKQKALRTARLALTDMEDLGAEQFNKFLSVKGRVKAKAGVALDFMRGLGGEQLTAALENLTGEDLVEFAADSRTVFEDIENVFAVFRKTITGAQAAAIELENLKVNTLNSSLSPARAAASYQNFVQKLRRQVAEDEASLDEGREPRNFFGGPGAAGAFTDADSGTTQIGRFQVREN